MKTQPLRFSALTQRNLRDFLSFAIPMTWVVTLAPSPAFGEWAVAHHAAHHAHHAAQFANMPSFIQTAGSVMNFNNALQNAMKNPLDDSRRAQVQDAAQGLQTSVAGLNQDFSASGSLDASQASAVQGALAGMVNQNLTGSALNPTSGDGGNPGNAVDGSQTANGSNSANPAGSAYDGQLATLDKGLTTEAGATDSGRSALDPAGANQGSTTSSATSSGSSGGQTPNEFSGTTIVMNGATPGAKEDGFAKDIGAYDTSVDRARLKEDGVSLGTGASELGTEAKADGRGTASNEDLLGALEDLQALVDTSHGKNAQVLVAAASKAAPKKSVKAVSKLDPFALTESEKRRAKKNPFSLARMLGLRHPATAAVGEEVVEGDGGDAEDEGTPWTRYFWITSIVLNLSLITYKILPLLRQWREKGQEPLASGATVEAAPIRTTWIR